MYPLEASHFEQDSEPFDAAYAPSDFALAGPLGTYHENLLAWLALRHRPNVMIVWFEA